MAIDNLTLLDWAIHNAKTDMAKAFPGQKIYILWDASSAEFTVIPESRLEQHEKQFGKLPIVATVLDGGITNEN